MFNKIVLSIIAGAVIISLIGIYLAVNTPAQIRESLEVEQSEIERLNNEIQTLNKRVASYIYTGQSVGYVIRFENGIKFYFSGPTGLNSDLELIGSFYKPDVAILPIGNIYTMDPKAAAYAASLVNPSSYIVPDRYKSFPELTKDPEEFFKELEKYNLGGMPLEFQVGKEKEILGVRTEWLGHGDWLLESPKGIRILVNPDVQYNPSFPQEYKELVQLKRIDLILLTNGHFDSISPSDIRKWGQLFNPVFIAPYELATWLKSKFPAYKIIAVNEGARLTEKELLKLGVNKEKAKQFPGLIINVVTADHSSSVIPE